MKNSPFTAERKDYHGDREAGSGARQNSKSDSRLLEGNLPQACNFYVTLEKEDDKTASLV